MIEGGLAGGSAFQQAAQRRATAGRLHAEAEWLEALAADERAMALQLATLPPAYALLHDLRLPGSKGNVDHLVIGPGGVFVVVIRRCEHTVEYRDDQLWADSQSLGDVLAAAEVESQLLTQILRTPVVGVVALLDATLPAAMPSKVAGVFVCTGELVGRIITRGSHTLLPPHQVAELTERALPLLHSPATVPRTESALGVPAEPSPDMSVMPMVPPQAPTKPRFRHTVPALATHEKSGRTRSMRFVGVALVVMCVLAVAFGSLVSTIWGDSDNDVDKGEAAAPRTTVAVTIAEDTGQLPTPSTTTTPVAPPAVGFTATCPAPGGGWQLTPIWPGDVPGLVRYDVEVQNLDSSWRPLEAIVAAQSPWTSLSSQPANAAYMVRVTAVVAGSANVVSDPTVIAAPATVC